MYSGCPKTCSLLPDYFSGIPSLAGLPPPIQISGFYPSKPQTPEENQLFSSFSPKLLSCLFTLLLAPPL